MGKRWRWTLISVSPIGDFISAEKSIVLLMVLFIYLFLVADDEEVAVSLNIGR